MGTATFSPVALGVVAQLVEPRGEAVQGLPAVPATRVIEVGRLFRIVSVRRVLSVTVLSAGAGICAYTYIADILGHAVGAARWVFVVLMVVYGVGAFAGSLGSGVVTDRVGPTARPPRRSACSL